MLLSRLHVLDAQNLDTRRTLAFCSTSSCTLSTACQTILRCISLKPCGGQIGTVSAYLDRQHPPPHVTQVLRPSCPAGACVEIVRAVLGDIERCLPLHPLAVVAAWHTDRLNTCL